MLRKLAELEDRNQALALCRLVSNLFRLFDGWPPQGMLLYLEDLFEALDQEGNGSQKGVA